MLCLARKLVIACLALAALEAACSAALAQQLAQQSWAQWRGPLGTGVAPDAQPPVEWSEKKKGKKSAMLKWEDPEITDGVRHRPLTAL
jgi:hypothetical protein